MGEFALGEFAVSELAVEVREDHQNNRPLTAPTQAPLWPGGREGTSPALGVLLLFILSFEILYIYTVGTFTITEKKYRSGNFIYDSSYAFCNSMILFHYRNGLLYIF